VSDECPREGDSCRRAAARLITTEAMVAELSKKPAAGPAMPPGGGMGGMDF